MTNNVQGHALLNDPVRNKGTAFTLEERRKYGLEGCCRWGTVLLAAERVRRRKLPYQLHRGQFGGRIR